MTYENQCVACGQRVSIHHDHYGSQFYLPLERHYALKGVVKTLIDLSSKEPDKSAQTALLRAVTMIRDGIDQEQATSQIKANSEV